MVSTVRRRIILAGLALAVIAAVILPFASDYRQLGERMSQRYAEKVSQASAAQRAQAEANAQAVEQGRRAAQQRMQEEDERQRLANGFDAKKAEFLAILHRRRPPVVVMVANLNSALQTLAEAASKPGFYTPAGLRPEETSSRLACNDPSTTMEMWNREARRDRNIFACGVYLALHRREIGEPAPHVTMALLQRIGDETEYGHYPFHTIVVYVWLQHLTQSVNQAQPPGAFPELNAGESYNPALLRGMLSPGFARRLIDGATTEEKLELSSRVYADLRRMAELGRELAETCRAMNRIPCLATKLP